MTATVTEDLREQVLGVVRKSQELTLDAVKQVVGTVNAAAEKLPAVPFAGRLPSLHRLPGVLPAPETVVSGTFDFLERLLGEQRKFADELVKAASGLRQAGQAGPAADGPAGPAARPAGNRVLGGDRGYGGASRRPPALGPGCWLTAWPGPRTAPGGQASPGGLKRAEAAEGNERARGAAGPSGRRHRAL